MAKKFLRTDTKRFSKLGKRRKKLQKWRRARGMHNKIRRKRFSYPKMPSIGYKKSSKRNIKKQILVYNVRDVERADKNCEIIIAKVGMKKRIEILRKASEMKIKIVNAGDKNEARK